MKVFWEQIKKFFTENKKVIKIVLSIICVVPILIIGVLFGYRAIRAWKLTKDIDKNNEENKKIQDDIEKEKENINKIQDNINKKDKEINDLKDLKKELGV